MRIAKVVGSAVATIKTESLRGAKLLVLQEAAADGAVTGPHFVAADAVGAGQDELVLISEGSAGRHTKFTDSAPVDAVIMAILDSLELNGQVTFRKS